MTEEELQRIELIAQGLPRPAINYWDKQLYINGGPVATFCSETRVANDIRDGLACVGKMLAEIRRLRSELASERATHQELWQMVDRELDRIYCDAKGIERSE